MKIIKIIIIFISVSGVVFFQDISLVSGADTNEKTLLIAASENNNATDDGLSGFDEDNEGKKIMISANLMMKKRKRHMKIKPMDLMIMKNRQDLKKKQKKKNHRFLILEVILK